MKKIIRIVFLLLLTIIVTDGYAQKKKKNIEFEPAVKEMIEAKNYQIRATTALPNGWRSISLDTRYSLAVKGDSVYCNLPYFGRAYRLPYGGGEGLIFDGVSSDYVLKEGKKGSLDAKFSVRTQEDVYNFIVTIFPNGSSSIKVFSNNKQSIDFMGDLIKEKED